MLMKIEKPFAVSNILASFVLYNINYDHKYNQSRR